MKFTIAIPITKTQFLKDTLDSIAKQTEKDFEVIIRNNGKDAQIKKEIKEVCGSWLNESHVHYFESGEQLSMPQNFNKILEQAKGDFFTVLSDDDVLEPDFLKELGELIDKYPETHVFHCRVKIINEKGEFTGISQLCPEWETQIDFVYHRITSNRLFYLSDFVVRTSELRKIGGFNVNNTGWGLDEITWSTLGYNGVGYSPKILLLYRLFSGNYTANKETLKNRFNDIQIISETQQGIIEENCAKKDCIYPKDFLSDINKKRTQELNDQVFKQHLNAAGILENLAFYKSYKHNLSNKASLKSVLKQKFIK
ncbi:MAG: glycosyltransferase family 2 protein [Cecembia sp.]